MLFTLYCETCGGEFTRTTGERAFKCCKSCRLKKNKGYLTQQLDIETTSEPETPETLPLNNIELVLENPEKHNKGLRLLLTELTEKVNSLSADSSNNNNNNNLDCLSNKINTLEDKLNVIIDLLS